MTLSQNNSLQIFANSLLQLINSSFKWQNLEAHLSTRHTYHDHCDFQKETEARVRTETFYDSPADLQDIQSDRRDPRTTQLYFCATMWHENEKEMLMMLKSILR